MTQAQRHRQHNYWKEPLCWLLGHKVLHTGQQRNKVWFHCRRCWKRGEGVLFYLGKRV